MGILKKGKMASKDLAAWFSISYSTYRKNKKEKLEELKSFCDYDEVYGGVLVKEVYSPIYVKEMDKIDDEIFLREVRRTGNMLSSVTGIANKLIQEGDKNYMGLNFNQVRYRMDKAGNRCFGRFGEENVLFDATKSVNPSVGEREKVWAIKVYGDNPNRYRYLTYEERKLFDTLITDFYGGIDADKIKRIALLEDDLKNKEISVDEYFTRLKVIRGFDFFDIIAAFKSQTGEQLVKVAQHEIYGDVDYIDWGDED